jgi:hypothetical protein
MRHFNREWKVTAYPARQQPAHSVIGTFFDLLPNAIEVTKLRVKFEIEKQLGKDPNTCTITIYNLNKSSRAFFQQRPLHVRIDAGHDGESRHLFQGDVRFGQTVKRGTEFETELQLGDGDRAFRFARVNRTFRTGTPLREALKEAARSLGLALPDNVNASPDLDQQFVNGESLVGPARDELTRLLAPHGYTWSIQNGALRILRDEETSPDEAILISQDTGMIGVPEFGAPDEAGGKPTLAVQCLLYPQVTPGGVIKVQSRDVNGSFRVQRVQHTGDSHGEDWTTEIEAKPL